MGKWSEATTIKFVELYSGLRCLWDITIPEYRNQHIRQQALQQIVVGMGLENFDVAEARVKVKSLRNTYLLELRKIERAQYQNNVYVPAMKWFEIMDTALKTMQPTGPRGPGSTAVMYPNVEQHVMTLEVDEGASVNEVAIDENPMEAPSKLTASLPMSELEEAWNEESPPKRPRQNVGDPLEVLHSRRPTPTEKDEFDTFGKYMAQALKNMPIHLALQCQNELQTTLTRFRFMSLGAFECSQDSSQESETQDPVIKTEPFEEVLLMEEAMFN